MITVLSLHITTVLVHDCRLTSAPPPLNFLVKWKVFPDPLRNFHPPLTLCKYIRRCWQIRGQRIPAVRRLGHTIRVMAASFFPVMPYPSPSNTILELLGRMTLWSREQTHKYIFNYQFSHRHILDLSLVELSFSNVLFPALTGQDSNSLRKKCLSLL